jgi:hypothetical protein
MLSKNIPEITPIFEQQDLDRYAPRHRDLNRSNWSRHLRGLWRLQRHLTQMSKTNAYARGESSHAQPLGFLIDDFEAHLARGAFDNAEGGFIAARVQVFALRVHDVHDLFARYFADLFFVRLFRAGGNVGRFLQ